MNLRLLENAPGVESELCYTTAEAPGDVGYPHRCMVRTPMTTIEKTKLLTAEDLLRLHSEGVRGELIRGVLHKGMASGVEHGELVMNLGFIVNGFTKPRRLGRVVGSDVGVRLERNPDTVREPDLAFVSADKLPLGVRNTGYLEVAPDLVVEIVSPSDRLSDVAEKARMWLSYGAALVWVIHPETRTVEAYRADAPVETLVEDEVLDGAPALPGFACTVRDVFDI